MFLEKVIIAVVVFILSMGYSYMVNSPKKDDYKMHAKNAMLAVIAVLITSFIFKKNKKTLGYLNQKIKTGIPTF